MTDTATIRQQHQPEVSHVFGLLDNMGWFRRGKRFRFQRQLGDMLETRRFALKWVQENDKGVLVGGTMYSHPYKKSGWQKEELPGVLCGDGYHAFDRFSAAGRYLTFRSTALWLVEVRNPTDPDGQHKMAGTNIRFVARLMTAEQFHTIKQAQKAYADGVADVVNGAIRSHYGMDQYRLNTRVSEAVRTAGGEHFLEDVLRDLVGTYSRPDAVLPAAVRAYGLHAKVLKALFSK